MCDGFDGVWIFGEWFDGIVVLLLLLIVFVFCLCGYGVLIDLFKCVLVLLLLIEVFDGGYIVVGYDVVFDDLCDVGVGGCCVIVMLEGEMCVVIGIVVLKVRYNGVFGYYVEVLVCVVDVLM